MKMMGRNECLKILEDVRQGKLLPKQTLEALKDALKSSKERNDDLLGEALRRDDAIGVSGILEEVNIF